jgi:hypothetical protein
MTTNSSFNDDKDEDVKSKYPISLLIHLKQIGSTYKLKKIKLKSYLKYAIVINCVMRILIINLCGH